MSELADSRGDLELEMAFNRLFRKSRDHTFVLTSWLSIYFLQTRVDLGGLNASEKVSKCTYADWE